MPRFVILVADSAGCGALPDAAEYGDEGASGVSSVKAPVGPSEPYTSSVETCKKRNGPRSDSGNCDQYCRATSSRRNVPTTLVSTNAAGESIDRSTCDSAAK